VRVEIEGGIIGFDEVKAAIGGAGACLALCALMEDELAPLLVGEDARDISRLWAVMYKDGCAHSRFPPDVLASYAPFVDIQ